MISSITESQVECHRIDSYLTEILLSWERRMLNWGEHTCGVPNVLDHPNVLSQASAFPNNASMSKWAQNWQSQSTDKNPKKSLTHVNQLLNDFCVSGDMQSCKFGHHNTDQKGVDKCKERLLNKENNVKGKTLEFQQMKREKKRNLGKKNKNRCHKKDLLFKETRVYRCHCGLHYNGGTVKHESGHTNYI